MTAECRIDSASAHTLRPVYASTCQANWRTVEGNERQIRCFAAWFGVNADFAVSVARCESGLRANAYNPAGPYVGTWQWWFDGQGHGSWYSHRPHFLPGLPGATPWNGRYSTIVTMRYVRHYGWGAWGCA